MAIEPLLIFLLLYFVFTSIRTFVTEDFAIYLLSGIVIYHIFSRGTSAGLASLSSNQRILQSFNLQKEIFPVASTLATSILAIAQIAILVMLLPVFQFTPSLTILLLPFSVMLILLLVLGISYFLSILNIYVRDTHLIWSIIITALLFISPIFWQVDTADQNLQFIQSINPLGQIIELNHKIVVFGEIPEITDWLYTLGLVLVILILGYATFRKFEKRMIEVI